MNWFARLGFFLAITGCSQSPGLWTGSSSQRIGSKNGVIVFAKDDRSEKTFLILAADYCQLESFNLTKGQSEKIDGEFKSASGLGGDAAKADGRKLPWSCMTKDSVRGTVTIDGQQFDLAKGGVFLISAKDDTKVEQLSIDLSKLSLPGSEIERRLQGVADQDPRLADFLKVFGKN